MFNFREGCWYYCWIELYTTLFLDSHMIFLVFVVVTFHTVSFGLWYSVVRWVPTNALEAAGLFEVSQFTHKAIWVIMQKTWNLACFSRWMCWYLNKGRSTWWHLLYYVSLLLNMFRMLIHPSSGACDYLVRYCVGCNVLAWQTANPAT